jgi:hypothetical protein
MKNTAIWVVGGLLVAGAGAGIYGARSFLSPAPAAPGLSSTAGRPDALPSNLPPLDESDDLVRRRASPLSAAPAFQEWLKLDSLIPRLVSAMSRVAQGGVPRDIFAAFGPRGKFLVAKRGGKAFVDPAGYARYDAFAALVQSVDAVAAARLFKELMPLFDAAQRNLGDKNASAHEAFFAASRELLNAPALEGEIALKERKKGLGWAFAEDRLESLSLAQKQLLRMGPKNQAAVQAKLRAVVLALGVPGAP